MSDILKSISAYKLQEIAAAQAARPLEAVEAAARSAPPVRSFADARCEKLSTGQRQKVSIARTILHDPPILILDEPTLGLDILIASTMIRFIQDCRERGKCIIFSTHIMAEVEKLCDRIGVIHGGRLRAMGTLEELRAMTGCQFLEDIFLDLLTRSTTKALG